MSFDSRIRRLPQQTRSNLRSTQILTSLVQIVAEFVQNSLDAEAQHIDVGINCEEWSCWIIDDGTGMSKDGLSKLALGDGTSRYSTSKAYNITSLDDISTYGFRGEAIASATDMCCVEISSRTKYSKDSWSIILKGGKALYNGPSIRWQRESHGTSVSVKDAFYNLPIRRLSHPNPTKTTDAIRRNLETYALVFPHVTFSLQNSTKERMAGSSKGHILTIPKTPSSLAAFRHLFGRALIEHVEDIAEQSDEMRLTGFISLVGAHTKAYQFLYVNNHLLDHCDLHRLIEDKFLSTSFAKHAYDELGIKQSPRPASRRSPRKAEKRPVYVLNLQISPAHVDNCVEPAKGVVTFKNSAIVSSFIMETVKSFLTRNGFVSERARKDRNISSYDSPIPYRKRRKVAIDQGARSNEQSSGYEDDSKSFYKDLFVGESYLTGMEEIPWTDSSTNQTYIIDPRTGNSLSRGVDYSKEESFAFLKGYYRRRSIVDTGSLTTTPGVCHDTPGWLKQALQGNETFRPIEPDIYKSSMTSSSLIDVQDMLNQRKNRPYNMRNRDQFDFDTRRTYEAAAVLSLTREELSRAQALKQVDNKFIVCLVEGRVSEEFNASSDLSKDSTLFLVDQHAADERIRVEMLLKDLCRSFLSFGEATVTQRVLQPSKPILLTSKEKSQIFNEKDIRQAFSQWGFTIEDTQHSSRDFEHVGDYVQVYISAIPEVVADKLLNGEELRELVKGYLARLQSESLHDDSRGDTQGAVMDWVLALRWCPKELVDLVNSKACRGAIMFNDPLSMDQCRSLIRRLSETRFPFICAHGRPSIIPLSNYERINDPDGSQKIDWMTLVE